MQTPDKRIKSAWDAVENGDLDKAQQLSLNLIKAGVARDRLPLVHCWTLRALHFAPLGKKDEAAALLHRSLSMFPDHPYPQELMSALLREEVMSRRKGAGTNSSEAVEHMGRFILGLGTGRSGSTSLAILLQAQEATYCTHELPPILPWSDEGNRLPFHLRRFALELQLSDVVADVSHWWLPRVERIADSFPDFRAVILKRDRQQTIESFLKIKGGGGKGSINHWVAHDGRFWLPNAWDPCYPKYPAETTEEAIGKYWDDYYSESERLTGSLEGKVKIFDIGALGSENGQIEILTFCGFENPVTLENLHANKGDSADGAKLWPSPFQA